MRTIDIFRLSSRMFKTNRMRTLLTILGISVGIGTILFLVSLGYGLQRLLINQITTSDTMLSLDVSTSSSSPIKIDQENLKKVESINGITEISPVFSATAQMKIGDLTGETSVNLSKLSFLRLSGIKAFQGELFQRDNENKIVVSSANLQLFNLTPEDAIGKSAVFSLFIPKKNEQGEVIKDLEIKKVDKIFEIIGVIDDPVSNYVFMPMDSVGDIDIPFYSQLKVKVKNQDNIANIKNEIEKLGFFVTAMSETITDANSIFDAINIILSIFGAVALIVSAIGMFNTMTIALLERTQEIGIMKTLGASRGDIWKLFLAESVIIGFLGGAGGIIIGYVGKYVINQGVNVLARSMGGMTMDLFYTPFSFVFFIIVFSTIVGFITGLYPSRRAAALNPLEALRYK